MRRAHSFGIALSVLVAAGLAFGQAPPKPPDGATQEACEGGDSEGCFNLGGMYASGRGVAKDDVKAAQPYGKACDGGNALGCHNLGIIYSAARGVAKDDANAGQFFQRTCDGGHAEACASRGSAPPGRAH
jgi:uncharacterized protein